MDEAVESVVRRLWLACVADSGILSSTFCRRVCKISLLCSLSGRELRALLTALNVPFVADICAWPSSDVEAAAAGYGPKTEDGGPENDRQQKRRQSQYAALKSVLWKV